MSIKYYANGDVCEETIEREDYIIRVTYYIKHRINEITYMKNDRYHRDNDEPAFIKFDLDGNILIKIYYTNGKCNRDNNEPAYIKYKNKHIHEIKFYIHGNIMRTDGGPTHIIYYKNSTQIKCCKYKSHLYFNYAFHNPNSPINIIVDNNLIHSPTSLKGGILTTYPGMIRYNKDGSKLVELHFHKGKIHRFNGPAKTLYLQGSTHNTYFVNNRLIENKQQWIKNWSKMFASNIA